MHWKKLFPSEHLESADVGAGMTIKVLNVEAHTVEDEKGKEQGKALIRFTALDAPRGFNKSTWIAPKTCAVCLAAMFGDDTAGWVGKRVTVHSEKVDAFGDVVDAVRISGSPDIERRLTIKARKGRKKVTIQLAPTQVRAEATRAPQQPQANQAPSESDMRRDLAEHIRGEVAKGADESFVRAACQESGICSDDFTNKLVAKLFPKAEVVA